MKKIITLIMMFVLSVGFLMAQGVFTYQAVVVDADGNLVVDRDVTAVVTVQSSSPTYVESVTGLHTSLNGLVSMPIGDPTDATFMNIDWKTATIKVQFTPVDPDVTIPTADYEPVPGVPYALQSSDDMLTTKMIADYYGRSTTTMDDMNAILDALESNAPLEAGLIHAFVDTIIHNRSVAKEILLYYLHTGTAADVQAMYNAFRGNNEVKAAFLQILKEVLQANRETVYYICRQYALQLNGAEMSELFNSIPDNVKATVVERVIEYVEDPAKKSTLIIPLTMDFVSNITPDEFDELVHTLENNPGVFNVMLAQFNEWMDDYFAHRFSGGSHVEDVIADAIEETYYAQCNPAIDLCQLQSDLNELNTCFAATSPFTFTVNANSHYIGSMTYTGTANPGTVSIHVTGYSVIDGDIDLVLEGTVNTTEKTISVDLDPMNLISGESFTAEVQINVSCPDTPFTVSGTYTEP